MRLVLIDTCIWVPFFSRPQSAEKQNVDALLDDDRATLIGPIVTEILQGIPREPQAAYIASLLRGLRCLEMEWEDWLEAARLGAGKNEQFAHSPRAARSRAFTSAHGAAIAGFSRYMLIHLMQVWSCRRNCRCQDRHSRKACVNSGKGFRVTRTAGSIFRRAVGLKASAVRSAAVPAVGGY
jgi:hypothetical protein